MQNNWKKYKLEEIAQIKYGKDHKKLDNGSIPCYGTGGVMRYVDKFLSDEISVLIPRKGSLNNIYFIDEPFWTVDTLFWSKINSDLVFPKYLYYNLKTIDFASQDVGSAVPSLTTNLLNGVELTIPPLPKQKQIAKILSALDDKIELNLKTNKTLEEMAMALYKNYFVDFEPFKNKPFIDSELGKIPQGWEVKSIGNMVKILGGYAFKSKDFSEIGEKVIKIKNISNNLVSINGANCISKEVADKTNIKFKIEPGSFLIAMTGAEVGKVGVVPDYSERLWLNQRVGMITEPKIENIDILIGNFMQSNTCYEIIQNLAYGSAQPNISTSGLESILIPLPKNIELIKDVLQELRKYHNLKIHNYKENKTLTKTRDTLLPKLISGEIELKQAEEKLN